MAQLRREDARIEAAGARVVVVGTGGPSFVAGFREATGFDGPVYCDEEKQTYRALGLPRVGVWRVFGPRVWLPFLRAMTRGFFVTRPQGDEWQMGGVLVIAPPGRVLYRHASEVASDRPRAREVVAALEKARR